jgi:hypothetical protein
MKDRKEEIYYKHYNIAVGQCGSQNMKCIYDAMEEYAQEEVKNLQQSAVMLSLPSFDSARGKAIEMSDEVRSITGDGKKMVIMTEETAFCEGFLACYEWIKEGNGA